MTGPQKILETLRVYLDNKLIGAMKHEGNPIMMSLDTIKNKIGAYPLIIGGLYTLPDKNAKSCEEEFKAKGKWAKMDFSSLTVKPIGTLYSDVETQKELSTELLPRVYDFLMRIN